MIKFAKKYGFAIGVFIVLMLIALFVDLPLDKAIYNPDFLPAILFESFGTLTGYLPFLLFFCLAAADSRVISKLRMAACALALAIAGIMSFTSLSGLIKRKIMADVSIGYVAAGAILLVCICIMALTRAPLGLKPKLYLLFGVGSVYSAISTLLINVLKLVWQRSRFDDMLAAGSFDAFTSWIMPFGNGGSSFPSGHTGTAGILFALIIGCAVFDKWRGKEKLVWSLCWAYTALMAASRLIIGRHFLSDTVAAAFLSYAVLQSILSTRTYKTLLGKVCGS